MHNHHFFIRRWLVGGHNTKKSLNLGHLYFLSVKRWWWNVDNQQNSKLFQTEHAHELLTMCKHYAIEHP